MWWIATASAAEPEPAPVPEPPAEAPIVLGTDEVLPSALDGLEAARQETPSYSLDALVPDWAPVERQHLRSQLFVRPVLGGVALPGEGYGLRMGGAVGHRLWTLAPSTVSFGSEERLSLTAPVGGSRGYIGDASVLLGPWLGPVGLRAGPTARLDRWDWGDGVVLESAFSLGLSGDVTVAVGKAVGSVGAGGAWFVGDGRGRSSATLVRLGDETTWRAGFGWIGQPVQWTLDGEVRDTAVGPIWTGGLSLQLRFL